MKRIFAILLLALLVFNLGGYLLLTGVMKDKSNATLEAALDNHLYDESELISLKIPAVNLAYYPSSKEFERVDGEIEVSGVTYKYVERRVFNDSLEMRCIPDHNAMELQQAKDDFFKLVNDLQTTGQGKSKGERPGLTKNFATDVYMGHDPLILVHALAPCLTGIPYYIDMFSSSYCSTSEQPPDPS